jgi:chromosome segregation ATPase
MPQRAVVTSVDAIEAFRSSLIVYLSKARPTLEEASADVLRMRSWLENDQRTRWEHEVRRRTKDLEQAQQALFSARLSNLSKATAVEQMAFHRARRALDEANEKLRTVKRWIREFDARVQPLAKQMEKLHTVLSHDMIQAASSLAQTLTTLSAYADTTPPPSLDSAAPASGPSASGGTDEPAKTG